MWNVKVFKAVWSVLKKRDKWFANNVHLIMLLTLVMENVILVTNPFQTAELVNSKTLILFVKVVKKTPLIWHKTNVFDAIKFNKIVKLVKIPASVFNVCLVQMDLFLINRFAKHVQMFLQIALNVNKKIIITRALNVLKVLY